MALARLALIVVALLATALPARAQQDEEGSKDHPMLSRMPGYFISDYDAQDFGSFNLSSAPPSPASASRPRGLATRSLSRTTRPPRGVPLIGASSW